MSLRDESQLRAGINPAHSQINFLHGISHLASQWKYRKLMILGRGSFGVVYSSMAATGEAVAVKKIKTASNKTNRELQVLEALNSPFCLKLIDHFYSTESDATFLNLVTEIMPESLGRLIRNLHQSKQPLNPLLTKLFVYELFAGISHLHSLGICHRDIKTDNCLVDPRKGVLKIIDYGCAKFMDSSNGPHQPYIASRIYRAPELLLNSTSYDNKIDIWAAGCVVAEILLDAIPMFQGCDNDDHLVQIMHVLGRPSASDEASFEHPKPFPQVEQICSLENALPLSTDENLLELLRRIFVYNPNKRPTAEECMRSPYFDELFVEGVKLPNGNPLPNLPRPA
ncbi:Glycogen synthase kinase-3 [Tritrichomonas foetus]|uniref:Glycogen synthase kinase-3 n=1 Tax=Tritrichomonas foetus TaxID=1144522 RepID=A0A1J4JIF2_9EUKA|nr:Glycogen synthase kinase-3 [Tritrichomonas foetus]|eukprot:OHS96972.1 Glycogen synthase kinase-3 [Tritrichomonas foetus]